MPALIYKLLHEDDYAGRIYEIIQHATEHTDILISYSKLYDDKELETKYIAMGGDNVAFLLLEVEFWLASEDAVNTMSDFDATHHTMAGRNTLCEVNNIIGISNDFLDCAIVKLVDLDSSL